MTKNLNNYLIQLNKFLLKQSEIDKVSISFLLDLFILGYYINY